MRKNRFTLFRQYPLKGESFTIITIKQVTVYLESLSSVWRIDRFSALFFRHFTSDTLKAFIYVMYIEGHPMTHFSKSC